MFVFQLQNLSIVIWYNPIQVCLHLFQFAIGSLMDDYLGEWKLNVSAGCLCLHYIHFELILLHWILNFLMFFIIYYKCTCRLTINCEIFLIGLSNWLVYLWSITVQWDKKVKSTHCPSWCFHFVFQVSSAKRSPCGCGLDLYLEIFWQPLTKMAKRTLPTCWKLKHFIYQ